MNSKNCILVFIILFVLGFVLYYNSFNNKFMMDDYTFLHNPVQSSTKFILSQWNPYREQMLGVADWKQNTGYYRPMAHMVLDVSYDVFKYNYWKYHLLNLFLYVIAAFCIYLFIGRVLNNFDLALVAAFFYLIHPINGIIVNYISASVFAFQVIFMLATILLLWESLEKNNHRILYALSLLTAFLSLFWNESGIMTPIYLSAVILLFGKASLNKKIICLLPFFLIIFCFFVFRLLFLDVDQFVLNRMIAYHVSGLMYAAGLFQVLMWYIGRLFYPQGIVMIWVAPTQPHAVFLHCLELGLLLLFYIFLLIRYNREKIIKFSLVWLLIGFLPLCYAAFRNPSIGAVLEPHWFVFSSIGFFILAAYLCLKVLSNTKIGGGILLFCLILIWGSFSFANNKLWADQKTYSFYWSQQVPSFKFINFFISDSYLREGDITKSREYLKLALADYPSDSDIYAGLGDLDRREGNWKGAELNLMKAVKLNPYSSNVYYSLGKVYAKEGQLANAKEYFIKTLQLNPLLLEARLDLATIFLKNHEYQKAIDLCNKNFEIKKDDINTLSELINIYKEEKDPLNMKKCVFRILNQSADPETLTNFGIKMGQDNLPLIAIDAFSKAIQIAPDYKDAYLNAGTLFVKLGHYDEAIHIWQLGANIDPADQRFQMDIAKAVKLNGPVKE